MLSMFNAKSKRSINRRGHVHLGVFTLLAMPMGVSFGYVSVTMGYLLAQAAVPVALIASLIAASVLPHVLKFIWAPLVDTTLTLKKWYLLSVVISSAGLAAMSLVPFKVECLPLLTAIVYGYHFAVTFLCMATEGLMGYEVPEASKGKAGGFFQAGNIGGQGLGGGLGLLLAQRLPMPGLAGIIMAGLCLCCAIPLIAFRDPLITIRTEKLVHTYKNLVHDVVSTVRTRSGLMGMFLALSTIGTGVASNLWASVANDWHASGDTVALISGVMGGLIAGAGCLVGGYICDRLNPHYAFMLFGLLAAVCAISMGLAPRTESMFILWTSLYAFINGLCYAGFSAFTLDTIGKGAVATKYNIFASLSNTPVYVMTYVLGIAYARFGPVGMLNTEAIFGVGAIVLFLITQKLLYQGKTPHLRKQLATPDVLVEV
jgi:MFS transporter, PAT family, beta-lactamase induction signal transducer AmpG